MSSKDDGIAVDRTDLLIVDDESPMITVLSHIARQIDARYDTARDGEEALEKIRERRPRVIVLDVVMPKMDGLQVCQAIRNDPELADIYVLMLSGQVQEGDVQAGLAAGAGEYQAKPFSTIQFRRHLSEIIDRQKG